MYPEDSYLTNLGRTLYANNYLEWLIIEVVGLLDPSATVTDLAAMEGGRIAQSFRRAMTAVSGLDAGLLASLHDLSRDYDLHVSRRNGIAHARPATAPDGKQRLYRWDVKRGVSPHFVKGQDLIDFAANALDLVRRFEGVRQRLRP